MSALDDLLDKKFTPATIGETEVNARSELAQLRAGCNAAIAAAVQAEREACAQVALSANVRHGLTRAEIETGDQVAASIAAAIRARNGAGRK